MRAIVLAIILSFSFVSCASATGAVNKKKKDELIACQQRLAATAEYGDLLKAEQERWQKQVAALRAEIVILRNALKEKIAKDEKKEEKKDDKTGD